MCIESKSHKVEHFLLAEARKQVSTLVIQFVLVKFKRGTQFPIVNIRYFPFVLKIISSSVDLKIDINLL